MFGIHVNSKTRAVKVFHIFVTTVHHTIWFIMPELWHMMFVEKVFYILHDLHLTSLYQIFVLTIRYIRKEQWIANTEKLFFDRNIAEDVALYDLCNIRCVVDNVFLHFLQYKCVCISEWQMYTKSYIPDRALTHRARGETCYWSHDVAICISFYCVLFPKSYVCSSSTFFVIYAHV